MTRLDLVNASQRCQNAAVPFNSGTRFGDRNDKADSRRFAAFFMPIRASLPSLSGGGGDTREGMPDFLISGSPTPSLARHPRLATWAGFTPDKEASHA